MNLSTKAKITWCPGCPDSAILVAFRQVVESLSKEGKLKPENTVALAGIGCHGKIADYLNMNTLISLHGRVIPTMTGVKAANPALTVVGFSGDGDSYAEGLEHLMHAAKRNTDVNLFVHDNQIFALTTGQVTPTSAKGFKGKSTPFGSIEEPLNPLLLMLSAGATFVARAYAPDIAKTGEIMKEAIAHKGFSYVDIIQPCISFNDTRDYYSQHMEWIGNDYPTNDLGKAIEKVRATSEKVPFGIFYRVEKPTFEEGLWG